MTDNNTQHAQAPASKGDDLAARVSGLSLASPPIDDPLPKNRQKLPGDVLFIVGTYLTRPQDVYNLMLCSHEMYAYLKKQLLVADVAFDRTLTGRLSKKGCTSALLWSIERGVTKNIKTLILQARWTLNIEYIDGMSDRSQRHHSIPPLHAAVLKNDLETVKLLIRADCARNIMYLAPPNFHLSCVYGAHFRCRTDNRCCKSALVLAIESGHYEIAHFLLEIRLIRLNMGVIPLHAAVLAQQPELVEHILAIDRNLPIYRDDEAYQALELAVYADGDNNSRIIDALCKVVFVDSGEVSALLHWAVRHRSFKHALTLLDNGVVMDDEIEYIPRSEMLGIVVAI